MKSMKGGKGKRKHSQALDTPLESEVTRPRNKKQKQKGKVQENEGYIGGAMSNKILKTARAQLEEIETAEAEEESEARPRARPRLSFSRMPVPEAHEASDDEGNALGSDDGDDDDDDDDATAGGDGDGDYESDLEIDPEDEAALEKFFMPASDKSRTVSLGDLIMNKIRQKEGAAGIGAEESTPDDLLQSRLDPKIVTVYRGVGQLLTRYKSGKLPKAFKIIASLHNWEEIVFLTSPENWSRHAMYAATKLMASGLSEPQAQRFYNSVLLPRVRDDIAEHKKLSYQLYQALKKALYKPRAFFKGILLPICEAGDCSLREATVLGSIMKKVTITPLESCAALLKIALMDYSGANSLFLRVLLDKKYALPFKVLDALFEHFKRFMDDERTLPVLWHQSLLVYAQRYKSDITSQQKEYFKQLLRKHEHHTITSEIRRELFSSSSRGEVPLTTSTKVVPGASSSSMLLEL